MPFRSNLGSLYIEYFAKYAWWLRDEMSDSSCGAAQSLLCTEVLVPKAAGCTPAGPNLALY